MSYRGIPLGGDRGVWDTVDHADEHARDVGEGTLRIHLPEPGDEGQTVFDDGTNWVKRVIESSDLPDPFAFNNIATTLTIADGEVVASQSVHVIEPEEGDSDSLETINGLVDRQFLLIRAFSNAEINVVHGTGNIHFYSEEDLILEGPNWLLLFYDGNRAVVIGAGGGIESFVGLADTPDSYAGFANDFVMVSDTEDGVVFGSPWPAFMDLDSDGLHVFANPLHENRLAVVGRHGDIGELFVDPLDTGTFDEVEFLDGALVLERGIVSEETDELEPEDSSASKSSNTGSEAPFSTYYYSSRFQQLILADELTAMGIAPGAPICSVFLECSDEPGQDLEDVRIRMQNTTESSYEGWETDGWTLVYGPTTISDTDVEEDEWFEFELDTDFVWDGNNLLVDFTRVGTDWTAGGGNWVWWMDVGDRAWTWYDDVSDGWPWDDQSGFAPWCALAMMFRVLDYEPVGTRIVSTALESGENPGWSIAWQADEPPNTEIVIETAVTDGSAPEEGDWETQSNWTAIDNVPAGDLGGLTLWIRQTLTTDDPGNTPRLLALYVYYDDAEYGLIDLQPRTANTFLAGPVEGEPERGEYRSIETVDLPDPFAFNNPASTLTIDDGAVTATQSVHVIAAESGTEDDLDTVNGLEDRQLLLLQADAGDTITVRHGEGNIHFDNEDDFDLSGDSWLLFFYDGINAVALGAGGGGGGGASAFTDLTDTPSAYTGEGEKLVAVNAGETALEFVTAPSGTHEFLFSQVVDVTVANTTTETTLLGAGRGSKTLTAGALAQGSVIVIVGHGYLGTNGTPTLNLQVTLGGTLVCSTGSVTLADTITDEGFSFRAEIVCRSTGATGSVVAGGTLEYSAGNQHKLLKTTATTIDTTGTLAVDATVTWGAAHASNTATLQAATIELIEADNLAVAAPSELTATEL